MIDKIVKTNKHIKLLKLNLTNLKRIVVARQKKKKSSRIFEQWYTCLKSKWYIYIFIFLTRSTEQGGLPKRF